MGWRVSGYDALLTCANSIFLLKSALPLPSCMSGVIALSWLSFLSIPLDSSAPSAGRRSQNLEGRRFQTTLRILRNEVRRFSKSRFGFSAGSLGSSEVSSIVADRLRRRNPDSFRRGLLVCGSFSADSVERSTAVTVLRLCAGWRS